MLIIRAKVPFNELFIDIDGTFHGDFINPEPENFKKLIFIFNFGEDFWEVIFDLVIFEDSVDHMADKCFKSEFKDSFFELVFRGFAEFFDKVIFEFIHDFIDDVSVGYFEFFK